jgi:hypothetical protein
MEKEETLELILVLTLFPLFWWGNVRLMAYLSGWKTIAARFPAKERRPKKSFWGQSAKIGWARYSGCVTVESTAEGIYLGVIFPFQFGHKPIFIPREEIRVVKERKILWMERVQFEVGSSPIGNIELAKSDFEGD